MPLQPSRGRRLYIVVALCNEDVELARPQQCDAVLGLMLLDGAAQFSMPLPELANRWHDQVFSGARECAERELAADRPVRGCEVGHGGIELGDHAVSRCHEPACGGG